ncbi:MAG TPA: hypothetical protein VIF02_06595 [Methylocella sp.]
MKAKIQEKPLPHELPKPPKVAFDKFGSEQGEHVRRNHTQPQMPFDSFGRSQSSGFSEIRGLPEFQERIGMAAGSVPETYLEGRVPLQLDRVPERGVTGGGTPHSPARAGQVSWRLPGS